MVEGIYLVRPENVPLTVFLERTRAHSLHQADKGELWAFSRSSGKAADDRVTCGHRKATPVSVGMTESSNGRCKVDKTNLKGREKSEPW